MKLDEYLTKRKQQRFDPQKYKQDGFLTKQAATMFNDICNPDLDGATRKALISSFVAECAVGDTALGDDMKVPPTLRRST